MSAFNVFGVINELSNENMFELSDISNKVNNLFSFVVMLFDLSNS